MLTDRDQALALTLAQDFDWGLRRVPLGEAGGEVLAEDVTTDRPQPPFDRVTMDGVAIAYAAYAAGRRRFRLAGVVPAGHPPATLARGSDCLEVMTGAMLPPGTTTVVPFERLESFGGDGAAAGVVLPEGLTDGACVHRVGSDRGAGELLLEAPRRLGAAGLAALATCGVGEVVVRRRPRAAVVSTGDELVDVGEQPLPHQIRRSNDRQLAYLLEGAGVATERLHLRDEPGAMRTRLAGLLGRVELLVLAGGVSRGRFDHVPETLRALGVERLVHGVAQKPGKPLWVGRTPTCMVFGLPGNPVSSLACALGFVGPWLRARLGLPPRPREVCRLATGVSFAPDLTYLRLAARRVDERGVAWATPVPTGGSGDAASVLAADGFAVLARGRTAYPAGTPVGWLGLGDFA